MSRIIHEANLGLACVLGAGLPIPVVSDRGETLHFSSAFLSVLRGEFFC